MRPLRAEDKGFYLMSDLPPKDAKRWAKEARSHRQALKKAGPPPNLFLTRLSRQEGFDRRPKRMPWLLLALMVVGGGAVLWWHARTQGSLLVPAPAGQTQPVASTDTVSMPVAEETAAPGESAQPAAAVAV